MATSHQLPENSTIDEIKHEMSTASLCLVGDGSERIHFQEALALCCKLEDLSKVKRYIKHILERLKNEKFDKTTTVQRLEDILAQYASCLTYTQKLCEKDPSLRHYIPSMRKQMEEIRNKLA